MFFWAFQFNHGLREAPPTTISLCYLWAETDCSFLFRFRIAKMSMTSPIVINVSTRELLAGETKSSFVQRFQHLNNGNNVCKQVSSLLTALAFQEMYVLIVINCNK